MNAALAVVVALLLYGIAYRFYARHLATRIFSLDPHRTTPAHRFDDGQDYLPTKPMVLFGHHWASITGLAPMLGPAVAVIWGWGPAMIWVVLGAIFVGCVHDLSALVISLRGRGWSVGKVAEGVIGVRAKILFLLIIFFGIALAMGVFTIAIAGLFGGAYGSAVTPSVGLMFLAATIGWLVYRKNVAMGPLAVLGLVVQLALVWLGHQYPVVWRDLGGWKIALLGYAFLASVLPVWSLLQPRDFLNSLLLYLGLALAFAGFFVEAPEFAAPALNPNPVGAPPIFPFVFITIACGAASGFHGLVASGTTAKQLDRETDAPVVGYGAMIGESLLGLLAVLATSAGFTLRESSPREVWLEHYDEWKHLDTQSALTHFIDGTARFVEALGIDHDLAMAFIAVLVVSFALTTLDSATRLLRYNVAELGESLGMPSMAGRYPASLIAVGAIAFFAFYQIGGQPMGQVLWGLFGTTNQLLAALTLLTVTLYLLQRRRNPWFTGIPMILMMVTTGVAMVMNLWKFSGNGTFQGGEVSWPLFLVGLALLLLAGWLVIEALVATKKAVRSPPILDLEVFPEN